MTKKICLLALAFTLALTLGSTAAQAQAGSGALYGTILDPSGALIPGAQVTVSNANGFSTSFASDPGGTFQVPHLAPGDYSVSINAAGFTSALEGGVQVSGDKVTLEEFRLGISITQEIDVTASAESVR